MKSQGFNIQNYSNEKENEDLNKVLTDFNTNKQKEQQEHQARRDNDRI
jgi:hypothetical protein